MRKYHESLDLFVDVSGEENAMSGKPVWLMALAVIFMNSSLQGCKDRNANLDSENPSLAGGKQDHSSTPQVSSTNGENPAFEEAEAQEVQKGNPAANDELLNALVGAESPDFHAAERALKAGAYIDLKLGGRPILTMLVRKENLEGVKFVLKNGANPNSRTFTGRTPLHEAAMYGFVEIAAELLRHGAEVNATNPNGETPLLYATAPVKHIAGPPLTQKHEKMAELLQAHGGVLARENQGGHKRS